MACEHLYSGADIRSAFDKSVVGAPFLESMRGFANCAGVIADTIRDRTSGVGNDYEVMIATRQACADRPPATAVYAGRGSSRDWCLAAAAAPYDRVETRRLPSAAEAVAVLADAAAGADVVFAEGLETKLVSPASTDALQLPAWVRQRVPICADWSAQLDALRPRTRQEIGRVLRKYAYRPQLVRNDDDFQDFYERYYLPHVEDRHGRDALIVDRQRFLRECRRGVLIRLLRDDDVLGGAVLRRIGNSMAVLWTALADNPGGTDTRGVTDALDYFSLLYASLNRCRWLDLGRSRPDLRNGLLRYKRKWGAELTPGFVPQARLLIRCPDHNGGAPDFLRRHALIRRIGRDFVGLCFIDASTTADDLSHMICDCATPGLRELRVIAMSALTFDVHDVIASSPLPVTFGDADSVAGAVAIAAAGQDP